MRSEVISGFISTDGYVAYSIFDDAEKHPGIVHIGCWVHARRKFIDALASDRRAIEIINMIAELFKLELAFKVQKLTPDQIKVRRERRFKTILRRIHNGINPETNLERLFKCIVSKETYDKRQLLPCYIKILVKLGKSFFCVIHITG